jgi:UDP:flavonoid glycosyltransferase YjiC (YdhE family)
MVPLAQALQAHGHEVKVATSASFAPDVADAGLAPLAVGRDWVESEAERTAPGFTSAGIAGQMDAFANLAEEFLDDLLQLEWRPDLVIREVTEFGSAVYARLIGARCVIHGITLHPPLGLLRHWVGNTLSALASRADADISIFDDGVLVNHFPPSWLPEQPGGSEALRFFAPAAVTSEDPAPGWVTERDGSRPLVYATLGTVFNGVHVAFEQLLGAADGADFDLLLTVGKNVDPGTLKGPSNSRIEQFVPQDSILGAVSAVVCHGGMGTVMGALRHGVPLCCIPFGADQPFNAARVEALGCGRSYTTHTPTQIPIPHARPEDLQALTLREHVDAVLGKSCYREAAEALAQEIHQLPGIEDEVDLVERLLSS